MALGGVVGAGKDHVEFVTEGVWGAVRALARESVLFIGTRFSNLYTAVDTPARGRVESW